MSVFAKTFMRASMPLHQVRNARIRGRLVVKAVGWDPEGILGAPSSGHITRRSTAKQRAVDADLDTKLKKAAEKAKKELEEKRASRRVPTTPQMLVEFFLDTEADEMEYEVARCRPLLDDAFFKALNEMISVEKFKPEPEEERMMELEALRMFLETGVKKLEQKTQIVVGPAERLKKLLGSKDKRAMILEMAGLNEIDTDLMSLLDMNIQTAEAAGQPPQVVEFLTKIKAACTKYVVPSKRAAAPAAAAAEAEAAPGSGGALSAEAKAILSGAPAAPAPAQAQQQQPPAAKPRAAPAAPSGSGLILDGGRGGSSAPAGKPPGQGPRPGSGSGLIL